MSAGEARTREQVIESTTCPACGARAGEKCQGTEGRGKRRKIHQARIDHDRLLLHLEHGIDQ